MMYVTSMSRVWIVVTVININIGNNLSPRVFYLFIYLLNTQLVQDIIKKTFIHTEMRKEDTKHFYDLDSL